MNAIRPELGRGGSGKFQAWIHWDIRITDILEVDGGPNDKMLWVGAIDDLTTTDWVVHPDVETQNSQFFQHQFGNWQPSPGNSCQTPLGTGFISGFDYLSGIERHEAGNQNSHHAQYVDAQNDPARNIKAGAEGYVLGPEFTKDQFIAALQDQVLIPRKNEMDQLIAIQPCGPGCTADCVGFNGYPNTNSPNPYQACPQ